MADGDLVHLDAGGSLEGDVPFPLGESDVAVDRAGMQLGAVEFFDAFEELLLDFAVGFFAQGRDASGKVVT